MGISAGLVLTNSAFLYIIFALNAALLMNYILRRSKRKTIGITVSDTAEVVVSAPIFATKAMIDSVIHNKKSWIDAKLKIVNSRIESFTPKRFINGEEFKYLGDNFKLSILNDKHPIRLIDSKLCVGLNKRTLQKETDNQLIKNKIITWYRKQAQEYLNKKATKMASQIGVNPILIKEKAYKRSWGMCHNNGKIFINYKLIMAPKKVIDYVIIHELCHLKHPNHSRDFWNLVALHCSDYLSSKKWLKDNGYTLDL